MSCAVIIQVAYEIRELFKAALAKLLGRFKAKAVTKEEILDAL